MALSNPRRLLPLIVAITATGVLTFTLITPTLPDLADALGVSRGAIGLVQGAAALPGVLLAMYIGYLADLKGRRFVAVWSLLLFGVAGIAGFVATSFWGLVATRVVQGIGASAILSLGVMVIGDVFVDAHERRRALGINGAGLTLTGLFSPILGGYLATGGVFRPFLVFAVALPVALWAGRLPGRAEGPLPAPPLQHTRAMFGTLRAGDRLIDFLGLLPFTTLMMTVYIGVGFTATPIFLEAAFDLGSSGRGIVQAFLALGSISTSLMAARLAQRFGPTKILSSSFLIVVVGFAIIAISPNIFVVAAGLLIVGAGMGAAFPLLSDFVISSVPSAYRGSAVGTWLASLRLGQAIGPIVGSSLAAGIGGRPVYWLAAGSFALFALSWLPLRAATKGWLGPPPDEIPEPLIR
jgi:MFS family permease